MASAAEKLGQVIGQLVQNQQTTNQNINGQSVKTTKNKVLYEDITLPGQVVLTKKVPESTSFQADHYIYGELNSDTLYLNSDYDESQTQILNIINF